MNDQMVVLRGWHGKPTLTSATVGGPGLRFRSQFKPALCSTTAVNLRSGLRRK